MLLISLDNSHNNCGGGSFSHGGSHSIRGGSNLNRGGGNPGHDKSFSGNRGDGNMGHDNHFSGNRGFSNGVARGGHGGGNRGRGGYNNRGGRGRGGRNTPFIKCEECQKTGAFCNHCTTCGESDHKRDVCPKNI